MLLRLDEIRYRIERKKAYSRTLAVIYRLTTPLRVVKKESAGFLIVPEGTIIILAERNDGWIETRGLQQGGIGIIVDVALLEVDDGTEMVKRRNPDVPVPSLIDMLEYLLFGRKDPLGRY